MSTIKLAERLKTEPDARDKIAAFLENSWGRREG